MNVTTVRHKPIKCPHCKRDQLLHLLAVSDKPALIIGKQTVRCVECERGFDLLDEPKIVDGPVAV
jgi:transposase-like protein